MTTATQTIAVFDFDGTLVTKDTFLILLKTGFKSQPWRCLLLILLCPIFLINFLIGGDRSLPKSVFLWCLTAFKTKKQMIQFLTQTVEASNELIWFQEGFETIQKLKDQQTKIVIATASGQIWVRALLRKKFPKANLIIGTKLKFFACGVVLSGKNCRDKEKLRRIQTQLGNHFAWESSWSDHLADTPILKAAHTPYIICPKPKHIPIFQKEFGENVKILNWNRAWR